jgi:4-carboxymuconolactone decarboxylase
MKDDATKKRKQETANKLFGKGIQMDPPYLLWKEFDRELANDFSLFITGKLYSRTVLTHQERQMIACATYCGMPTVNIALEVYRAVLKERGEWPLNKEYPL